MVATAGAEAVEGPSVVVRTDDSPMVERHRKTRDGGGEFVNNDPKYPPRRGRRGGSVRGPGGAAPDAVRGAGKKRGGRTGGRLPDRDGGPSPPGHPAC